jgi:hypothetical protein
MVLASDFFSLEVDFRADALGFVLSLLTDDSGVTACGQYEQQRDECDEECRGYEARFL